MHDGYVGRIGRDRRPATLGLRICLRLIVGFCVGSIEGFPGPPDEAFTEVDEANDREHDYDGHEHFVAGHCISIL